MTLIVGYPPDARGKGALHLASMLARSSGEDLVVASVIPAPWIPGMAKIDAEYRAYLDQTAEDALERARANLPEEQGATFVRHSARSAAVGLLELAEKHAARVMVLGSSSHGSFGHVALGSTSDRLVHSSPVTLALAPRGFRCSPDQRVVRATAAYGGSGSADHLVLAAGQVAADVGAALRIASFAVWARPAYTTRLGSDSEDPVLTEWTRTMQRAADRAVAAVEGLTPSPPVETVLGRGTSWGEAIDDVGWGPGDVLVVGSSDLGPLAQVFLGSRATKIVRHSPVPVLVVPRGRSEELAHA
jgi:nucleotide-binding universal stress UspA family protein